MEGERLCSKDDPVTATRVFNVRSDAGADYSIDNVTGLDTCEKTYAPAHAVPAPAAMQGVKPACPTGYRLLETVTQTAKNGGFLHTRTRTETETETETGDGVQVTRSKPNMSRLS